VGANRGIAATSTEFVLLLNSDAFVSEGAVERLEQYLRDHPSVAVAGPRLLNADGTLQASCFPSPGTLDWLIENEPVAPFARLVPPMRRRMLRYSPLKQSGPVPWVLGSALAIRRKAFEQAGGFDESFFMYFEEVDLCRRIVPLGWEVHFVADAEVVHVGGGSTSQLQHAMAVAHFRSCLQFYRRHYRGPRRAFWIGAMRVKMIGRLIRDMVRLPFSIGRRRRSLRAAIRGWRDALKEDGS
jgi:GT2 family glycosyltransferase